MATPLSTILADARLTLLEVTARYWSDAELLGHANAGIKDLWKGLIDLYKDHFVTFNTTDCTLPANTSAVSGVPADLFRVIAIQPRVVGPNSVNPGLIFHPRELIHNDFVQAEAERGALPRHRSLYYATVNAGAPVAAPVIRVAPVVTSAVLLEIRYVPVLADRITTDVNPIPGESDLAVKAWVVAWARAKERPDRSPDPEYIAIYATEKRNLLGVNTPRSIQEPEVVESLFMDYAGYGLD